MSDVSCRILALLVTGEQAGLLRAADVLKGIPIAPDDLTDPEGRMPWETWCLICDRLAEQVGRTTLERLGAEFAQSGVGSALSKLKGITSNPQHVYQAAIQWVWPSLFRNIRFVYDAPNAETVDIAIAIPEADQACLAWFVLTKGALPVIPQCIDMPNAEIIEAHFDARRARIKLRMPLQVDSQNKRSVFVEHQVSSLIDELALQQRHLAEAHQRLKQSSHSSPVIGRVHEQTTRMLAEKFPDVVVRLRSDGMLVDLKVGRSYPNASTLTPWVGQNVQLIKELSGAVADEMLEEGLAALRQALKYGNDRQIELYATWGGTTHDYDCLIIPFDANEAIVLARDVTEKKRRDQRLAMTAKMVAVGTLASGVAHEINNPLTYVLASLDMALSLLQHDDFDRETLRRRVGQAHEGSVRVRDIVRKLGDFSRVHPVHLGPVDVPEVITAAIALTAESTSGRARLVTDFSPCPKAHADASRLTQVVVNLLLNAAQATPEGAPETHEICVQTSTSGDGRVLVVVRDTGVGISAEVMPHIFDPFFTTKQPYTGTGLGLWICQRIVLDLGGDIFAESESGDGACFRVLLPAAG